ncbi:MAG: T9SS type A sorting domain-containing protein [Saprospiraceae bacterium]|nr:T9SS type A sorting domain-containing protein [Saprospiraceae bacterium]
MKFFFTLLTVFSFLVIGFGQAPPNDNCANAIVAVTGVNVSFTTVDATTDGPFHPNSPCPSAVNDTIWTDIWYTYTADFSGLCDFSLCNNATFDTKIAVYKPGTTCPAQDGDLLTCNDDAGNCGGSTSRVLFDATAGQTYLLRIGGYGETAPGLSGTGSFILSQFIPALPNDFCEQAQVVSVGEDQAFTNVDATTDGPIHPGNNTCFGFNDPTVQSDIWYKFTAPQSGSVLWSTCNTVAFDSRLAVYSGNATCPLLDGDLLACNDDGSGCNNFTSKVFFNVQQGQTYLLRLGGFGGAVGAGTFDLILSDPPPPPANDLCPDALEVALVTAEMADDFEGQTDGTTTDGSFDPNNYIFPNAQCFGTNTNGGEFSDVWYQFNTLGNEELELRFYSGGDQTGSYYAELFEACDLPVDTSVIFGSCVFVDPTTLAATTLIGNLPPTPTLYLMRVTTRLTTQLPGDFFFYLVAEITEPSAAKDNFPGESRVFPNPAGDKLYLNLMLNESIETTAQIVNAMGQVVLNKQLGQVAAGNHQFPFEVAVLPKGVYFLQLYSDKGIKTAKFVKA